MTPAAPPRSVLDVVAAAIIVWTIASTLAGQLEYSMKRGNRLSEIADPYSEANVIKAAEGYAVNGLTSHYGLAEPSFGTQFDRLGGKYDPNLCPQPVNCIYLHYPPGPELIAGVMTIFFGVGKVVILRVVPLLVGLLGMVVLARAAVARLGLQRAAWFMVGLWMIPLYGNMMHGLHMQGYALSALLVEMGILLRLLDGPRPVRRATWAALFATGFFQGWMSFDYFFIVAFAPVPFWILGADRGAGERRTCARAVVVAGGGFAFAHLLHLIQVALFLGGLGEAVRHMSQIAMARAVDPGVLPLYFGVPFGVAIHYWFVAAPEPRYFNLSFVGLLAAFVTALAVRGEALLPLGGKRDRALRFAPVRRAWLAPVVALLVSSLWLIVMQRHSRNHTHFLPRHLFLAYAVGLLAILRSTSVVARADVAAAA
jgi:hypothetical protein